MLNGKKIILGVCGGIAAYKTAELIRRLKKAGAEVQVLMTRDAARFITPLTLGTLSEREVLSEIFPENEDGSWTKHIGLGLWADLFVIAPATAQTMAKLAHGFSDSMLTATALAARCPIMVCPAMDHDMMIHPATQANLERLRRYGYDVMPPNHGELASGLIGEGRLPEPHEIVTRMENILSDRSDKAVESDMADLHVVVSAGPTREVIDPVRYLTNRSTGTMGYALAAAAARRGARVTLVSGPTSLPVPDGVTRVDVDSAESMHAAMQAHRMADLIIMAAAVADYTPAEPADHKLKKTDGDLVLRLRRTPDILAALGQQKQPGQRLVGFALETDEALANARRKLKSKNLDWIVLNNLRDKGAGFGTSTNRVTLLSADGDQVDLPLMDKSAVAEAILDHVAAPQPTEAPA